MLTRRTFTKWAGILPSTYLLPGTCSSLKESAEEKDPDLWVNDIHSQLNATHLRASVRPASAQGLQQVVHDARERRFSLCIAGGRHAMGGQQFLSDGVLVDTRGMNRIVSLDRERGLIEVGAGIEWPELIDYLEAAQAGSAEKWTIAQKQTGADRLTLGGALSANAHGRGLAMKPIIADVESFTLVGAGGELRKCSRTANAELFKLAIGGYGLFGIIATVTLRLVRRQKVERVVEIVEVDKLMPAFEERIAAGFPYGDWQYSIDPASTDFLSRGVFSCYRPVDPATPMSESPRELTVDDWRNLIYLAHADKKEEGVGSLFRPLPRDIRPDLLVRPHAAVGLHRRLSPRARSRAERRQAGDRDDRRDLRAATGARRHPRRGARGLPRQCGQLDLRDRAARRARQRKLPGLGHPALGLRDLQPARGPRRVQPGQGGGGFSPRDRPRPAARRQLLSHLPPLGEPGRGGGGLSEISRIPAAQAAI
jgi:FAD/FMN-containing dehydrogenase